MSLFYLKYTLLDAHRDTCMILFGGMSAEDDAADVGPDVTILGRWATVGECSGYMICTATDADALNLWLVKWSTMATITVTPILDDNQARRIVLKATPPYVTSYDSIDADAREGECLYAIEYTFHPGKKMEGYGILSRMTEDDAGPNTCYGRWHNLGSGTGFAVCSSKSELDVYTWAYAWGDLCDCVIRPVVKDEACRHAIVSTQPNFWSRHRALLRSLGRAQGWFW